MYSKGDFIFFLIGLTLIFGPVVVALINWNAWWLLLYIVSALILGFGG